MHHPALPGVDADPVARCRGHRSRTGRRRGGTILDDVCGAMASWLGHARGTRPIATSKPGSASSRRGGGGGGAQGARGW